MIQYFIVDYSSLSYSIGLYFYCELLLTYNTVQYGIVHYGNAQFSDLLYSCIVYLYRIVLYCITFYFLVYYSTLHCITIHYSTIYYITIATVLSNIIPELFRPCVCHKFCIQHLFSSASSFSYIYHQSGSKDIRRRRGPPERGQKPSTGAQRRIGK